MCCPGTVQCGAGTVCTAGICARCGAPGDACCTGNKCDGAGCCLGGRCFGDGQACSLDGAAFGQCAAGQCQCGSAGQRCCPSATGTRECREADTVCSYSGGDYFCVKCGGPGGPCCTGNKCGGNGCCVSGLCAAEGSTCPTATPGICKAGACECGKSGQPCCRTAPACSEPGNTCSGTPGVAGAVCSKCGEPGAACCPNNVCTSGCCVRTAASTYQCVNPAAGCGLATTTNCAADGSCGTCGGKGQPCCAGTTITSYRFCTTPGTYCNTTTTPLYTCVSCGGAGQPCCGPNSSSYGTTSTGTCSAPTLRCTYTGTVSPYYFCQ
jgi:hypothetical protein